MSLGIKTELLFKMNLIEKIQTFLKQPYPFYYRGKSFVVFITIVFFLGLAFNYFIEPFNVYVPEHKMDYFYISLIHSFTPVVISILCLPFFRNQKIDDTWTVGKEIILLAIFLFLIGLVQFLIRDLIYDNPNNWSWKYFFEEIRNTFLVGTFILIILISLNHNRLHHLNNNKALELNTKKLTSEITNTDSIHIKTKVKGDDFDLTISEFVFAKSEGNYVELQINNGSSIQTLLKRISIKEFGEHLKTHNHIQRIHRSYLVNLHCIERVSGNAQGYQLQLKNIPNQVPVSRNMIPEFEKQLKISQLSRS